MSNEKCGFFWRKIKSGAVAPHSKAACRPHPLRAQCRGVRNAVPLWAFWEKTRILCKKSGVFAEMR
jgi:hypothetical protein